MFLTRLAAVGLLLSLLAVSLDGKTEHKQKISNKDMATFLKNMAFAIHGAVNTYLKLKPKPSKRVRPRMADSEATPGGGR